MSVANGTNTEQRRSASRAVERCSCVLFSFMHRPRPSSTTRVGYFTSSSDPRNYRRVCVGDSGSRLGASVGPAYLSVLSAFVQLSLGVGPVDWLLFRLPVGK